MIRQNWQLKALNPNLISATMNIHKNLSPEELKQHCLRLGVATLGENGTLVIRTGQFTGRSPKDKFFVRENASAADIDWNEFNIPIEEAYFLKLREDILRYLDQKEEVWEQEVYAGADPDYRIAVTCLNEWPDSNLFVCNMFICRTPGELFIPEWKIIQAPGFRADPAVHGTRQQNFAVISLAHKTILIGGTGYTGEIKKGMFTVMNYLLPKERNVLTMHCSANQGADGDVALFFGLSGTGKTTLSADAERRLIGDDEHAWTDKGIFNIEGGCYAKVIDLSPEKEPQIFRAVRDHALVENVTFFEGSKRINYADRSVTENTRVSYPLAYIDNAVIPSVAGSPRHIFFLTCDAFGVLPPLSRLSPRQAMYYFLSGYTARIAGTEEGVKEPRPTFSTCFGAPFLPLAPHVYAEMLRERIDRDEVSVWMVNTGWTGGGYGTGERIRLSYTRAMIRAVLNGSLKDTITQPHPVFGLEMPLSCPGVPSHLLNPANTWTDKALYETESRKLAELFRENYGKKFGEKEKEIGVVSV